MLVAGKIYASQRKKEVLVLGGYRT